MSSLKEEYKEVELDSKFGNRLIKKFGKIGAKEIIINQLTNQKYKSDIDAYIKETDRNLIQDLNYPNEFKPKDSLFESKLSRW